MNEKCFKIKCITVPRHLRVRTHDTHRIRQNDKNKINKIVICQMTNDRIATKPTTKKANVKCKPPRL